MKNNFIIEIIMTIIILCTIIGLNNISLAENEELEANETTEENKIEETKNEENNNQDNANEIEETKEENETQEQDQQYKTVNSEPVTEVIKTKSSNAYLRNLGIKPYDFTGFRYGTTNYNVTVPENTKSIEVYAEAQDSKAKLAGIGIKTLEDTKTKVDVVVTAEDGTKKTYTINITKGEVKEEDNTSKTNTISEESNTDSNNTNIEEKSNGLASLKINDLTLSPDFKTHIYEYNLKYIGKEESLDIKTQPTNADYIVEVVGNTDLKEGENIITILVTDKNGENIATYQITVDKSLKGEIVTNSEDNQKYLISAGIIGTVFLIIVIVFIVKRKRNTDYYYEYEEEEEDDNDEYTVNKIEENGVRNMQDDEEELPKALHNKYGSENKYDYEEMSKEKARKSFLDGYDNIDNEYKNIRNNYKGKRFK